MIYYKLLVDTLLIGQFGISCSLFGDSSSLRNDPVVEYHCTYECLQNVSNFGYEYAIIPLSSTSYIAPSFLNMVI